MIDKTVDKVKNELGTYSQAIQQLNDALEYTNSTLQESEENQNQNVQTLRQQMADLQTENRLSKTTLENKTSSSSTNAEQMVSDLNSHFQLMFETQKSNFESIKMKVDSMDNTYDKRISNLEAVITPLLSDSKEQLGQTEVQEIVSQELKQVVKIMDEKVRKVMTEKDHKIDTLESEVKELKQLIDVGIMNQAAIVQSPTKKMSQSDEDVNSTKPQTQKSGQKNLLKKPTNYSRGDTSVASPRSNTGLSKPSNKQS